MQSFSYSLLILIGSWLTVSTVFLAGEIAYRYGAIAGLFITVSFLLAFICSIPFLKTSISFGQIPVLFNFMQLLYVIRNSMIIFILLYFMVQVFQFNPLTFSIISALLMLVLYGLYTKWSNFHVVIISINAVFIFAVAIFLPSFLYLQLGIETVYHNLQHYHPSTLYTSLSGKWQVFVLLTGIFFLHFFAQLNYLKQLVYVDYKRGLRKLFIAVFIIGTLLLSFSTVTIVALTKDIKTDHVNALLLAVIQKQSTGFIYIFIFGLIYALIFLEMMISFYVFKTQTTYKHRNGIFMLTVFVSSLCTFILLRTDTAVSVLSLFIIFGVIIATITVLLILFSIIKVKKSKKHVMNL